MTIVNEDGNIIAAIEDIGGGLLMIPDEILYLENEDLFVTAFIAAMKKRKRRDKESDS